MKANKVEYSQKIPKTNKQKNKDPNLDTNRYNFNNFKFPY